MGELNAESGGSSARFRRWGSWLFWIAAVAIALASTATIMRLLDHADSRRQTQIVLADINLQASKLRLVEVPADTDPTARADFREAVHRASRVLPEAAARLLDLDPAGDAADRVREALDQYRRNAEEHLRLLADGDDQAARAWERDRSRPSFDLLQEATSQSGIFYSAQATRSLRRVRVSAAVAIGSEALLIGLLAALSARGRQKAQQRLLDERDRHAARFETLVHNSADVIAVLDAQGVIRYTSSSVERVLGYGPDDSVGRRCHAFIDPKGRRRTELALRKAIEHPDEVFSLELPARHADGSLRWIDVSTRNLLDDPNVGGLVINYRDVTEERELRDELRHRALHDPLTGLANRDLFSHQVEKALARGRRTEEREDGEAATALLYLDLDGFKPINDTLGHEAGDELLVRVARRLERNLRETDAVARLGGDEFAILLDGTAEEEAVRIAERMVEDLQEPYELAAGEAIVGVSIGIAVAPAQVRNPDELLREADMAMYLAKSKGKGRCELFQPNMPVLSARRTRTAQDLERALARVELTLQYQPVIQLDSGQIIGVEALVRWKAPESGRLLPPSELLPLAEESGLILPLGRWVLGEACRQARRWQLEYPSDPPLLLSVNLSASQLRDPRLTANVRTALMDSGLDPSSLVLEIAEKDVAEDVTQVQDRLADLRNVGVLLAIDDFSFGPTSLDHLRELAVDLVKIDKGIIDHISLGGAGSRLALHKIQQARRLSSQTVAEGVETDEEVSEVAAAGCDLAQGFSLARPLDPTDLERLLQPRSGVRQLPRVASAGASTV